ncbi:MAG: tetratricopeptide repeat protein [Lachnospiraceae bacterium]|nr:tetratricopeptide repeat protein [Lachnospiraceae bacterium]
MDKSDSRLHCEQIERLMKAGRYNDAVFLVDKVDWRKEEDIKRLTQAAEAYRRTRRYDDAVNILKMAHNKKPNNKKIVYLLCETYFESKDVVTAQVYLDRYQSMTDKSDWHYDALKYKRSLAYDLPVTEKIDILVDLKRKEPAAEQFRFELAKLYNQARQYAECAAECDELILLFGDDGKFARKSLELKKSCVPLTQEQETLLRKLSLGDRGEERPGSGNVKIMNTMDMSALNLESSLAKDIQTLKSEEGGAPVRRKRPEFHTKSLEQTIPPSTQEVFFSDKTEDISFTQYDLATSKAADIREVRAPKKRNPELEEMGEHLYSKSDGQISFTDIEFDESDDEQAPGQITMDDLLSDWSKIKERNTQNLRKSIHADVVEQTGKIFEKKKEDTYEEPEEEPGSIWKEVADLDDEFAEETVEENVETEESATDLIPEDIEEVLEEGGEQIEEEIEQETDEEIAEASEAASEDIEEPETEESGENVNDSASESDITKEQSDSDQNEKEEASSYDEEEEKEHEGVKDLSPEERKLFSQFLHPRSMRTQIANALENISLASYVGNVIITTDNTESGFALAKSIVKFVKFADVNFSGAMSSISAGDFNNKNIPEILDRLNNGALAITEANKLSNNALIKLTQGINQEERGILIFLIDSRAEIKKLVSRQRTLTDYFNIRIDIIAMSEASLVDYGMKYANNLGYSIDEGFANMAFHKRVREAQAGNHTVTIAEVKGIVDEAIDNNKKRTVSNLFRKISKKMSDENGMIMLREKDFE